MKKYEIELFIKYNGGIISPVASVRLNTITQVAKFLETVDFEQIFVEVYTPKNNRLFAEDILKIWRM